MGYISEKHYNSALAYEKWLQAKRTQARGMTLYIQGMTSDAHIQAFNHLITWARENRNLLALQGRIIQAIQERRQDKAKDSREIQDMNTVAVLNGYHDTYVGVYEIALAELESRYQEFVSIVEREQQREREAFSQTA